MSYWSAIGATDEWYTPPEVFEALGCSFDMDVAHPADCRTCVPARMFLCANSLEKEWKGFVWMNPPYGGRNCITPWMRKFFAHGNGIALTPDRTSTPWFWECWQKAELVMFTKKIKFIDMNGERKHNPPNGSAFWAVGEKGRNALWRASAKGFGIIAKPVRMDLDL